MPGDSHSPIRGPNSAKHAIRGNPPPHPTELGCPGIKNHHSRRRLCQNTGSLRCRGPIAFSRSQFGEIRNARQSSSRMIFSSYRHARNNNHSPQSACQNRDSHTSTPGMSVLAKSRSAKDDTSPTNPRGFCKAQRAAPDRDYE